MYDDISKTRHAEPVLVAADVIQDLLVEVIDRNSYKEEGRAHYFRDWNFFAAVHPVRESEGV